jgi:hypothetical protein
MGKGKGEGKGKGKGKSKGGKDEDSFDLAAAIRGSRAKQAGTMAGIFAKYGSGVSGRGGELGAPDIPEEAFSRRK